MHVGRCYLGRWQVLAKCNVGRYLMLDRHNFGGQLALRVLANRNAKFVKHCHNQADI
jgi:hypothetical protein